MRLTVWVVLIFVVIQGTLAVVFLLYERASMDRFLSRRLEATASRLADQLAEPESAITDARLRGLAGEQAGLLAFERFSLTVYDGDGAVVASSGAAIRPADRPELAGALAAGRPAELRLPIDVVGDADPSAVEARGALRPFRVDGARRTLLATTSDAYTRRMFRTASGVLAFMLGVGVAASGVAGWFIAGLAIAPLRRVHDAAHRLTPESMGERVDLEPRDSELASLETELEEMRQRINAAFQAQQRFISNVSHELKTPISVLLAEAQVLTLDDAPHAVRGFVASVRDEMARLGGMIDSFLLLTRVREGRAETVSRRCGVNDLLLEVIEDTQALAAQHGVRLAPELLDDPERLDAAILGDPHLLRTMLDNLAFNAIRFSPAGERVELRAAAEGGHAALSVRDRGPGIPEELIDHVFDRFAQSSGERRRGRGHGLGLEIAQGIAELHGGSIGVRNLGEEGREGGCEFTVRLPLIDAAPAGIAADESVAARRE